LTCEHLRKNHGRSLLEIFEWSPSAIVSAAFPDFTFLPWLFIKSSNKFFSNRENLRAYITWLVAKTGVKSARDLRSGHFADNNGSGLLRLFNNSPHLILEYLESNKNLSSPIEDGPKPKGFWVLFQLHSRRVSSPSLFTL